MKKRKPCCEALQRSNSSRADIRLPSAHRRRIAERQIRSSNWNCPFNASMIRTTLMLSRKTAQQRHTEAKCR